MRNIFTIFRKELAAFFSSLVAYIVMTVFLVSNGLFFWIFGQNVMVTHEASMDSLFANTPYFFLFLIPAITMRSFSEEYRSGTMEFLSTKPVSDWQIILGKYFASVFLVMFCLLPTMIYYVSLQWLGNAPREGGGILTWGIHGAFLVLAVIIYSAIGRPAIQSKAIALVMRLVLSLLPWLLFLILRSSLGNPIGNLDTGPIWGAYIGLVGLGAIFCAIGIFTSSLTSNQVVAFIFALFLCFSLMYGFGFLSELLFLRKVNYLVDRIGINAHFESISMGVVDTRDILYFLSLIVLALFSTRAVLTWRKA